MLVLHVVGVAAMRPGPVLFGLAAVAVRPALALLGVLAVAVRPALALLGVAVRPALALIGLLGIAVRPARVAFGFVADVTLNPNSDGMPGAGFAQTLIDWTGQIALWGSLVSILVGAAIYGVSQHIGNTYGASKGRLLALAGAVGAGLTGVAPTAINLLHTAAGR